MDRAHRKRRNEAKNGDGPRQRQRKRQRAGGGQPVRNPPSNRGGNRTTSSERSAISESSQDSASRLSLTQDAVRSLATGVPLLPVARIETNTIDDGTISSDSDKHASAARNVLVLKLRVSLPEAESNGAGKGPEAPPGDMEIGILTGTLGDGTTSIKVLVIDGPRRPLTNRLQEEEEQNDWIVAVRGYATTEQMWNVKYQLFPAVCLTSITILSTCPRTPGGANRYGSPLASSLGAPFTYAHNSPAKAHAGTIGSFLVDRAPFFTNEELAGSHKLLDYFDGPAAKTSARSDDGLVPDSDPQDRGSSSTHRIPTALFPSNSEHPVAFATSKDENLQKVQVLLSRHSAMMTLQSASSSSLPCAHATEGCDPIASSPARRPAEQAWDLYSNTLREFTSSQIDRQKASLGTNAGKESANRAVLVVERHNTALDLAMKEQGPLSTELLCSWHKELLNDLHPDAGKIRTRTVRCGLTVFAPPDRIRLELQMYCDGLQYLETCLDLNKALDAVLFAAVAMYGVVDIHPFLDGNGRLSRIVANYALRKLPFPINLFATPAQRAEYVLAMEKTRHCLSLTCAYGDVSNDDLIRTLKCTGVFSSLVNLLLDRVARAAMECNRVWEEKSGLAAEAAEDRAARRARERASQGTCMICLEERPNIATLCCGKPTHLNCIAEWLSGQTTCPICRSEMPPISGRVIRAAVRPDDSSSDEEEGGEVDDVTVTMTRQHMNETTALLARVMEQITEANRVAGRALGDHDSSTTGESHDEDHENANSTTASYDEEGSQNPSRQHENEGLENDETITFIQRRRLDERNYDATTTTFDEDNDVSEDTTHETTPAVAHYPPRTCLALSCRNRPAVDCRNSLCGRCCVFVGRFHCPRHNS